MSTGRTHRKRETTEASDEFVRVSGLFRRWELESVLQPGFEYRIEEHGQDEGGTKLFAVYEREPADDEDAT